MRTPVELETATRLPSGGKLHGSVRFVVAPWTQITSLCGNPLWLTDEEPQDPDADLDAKTLAAAEAWGVEPWQIVVRLTDGTVADKYLAFITRLEGGDGFGPTRLAALEALREKAAPKPKPSQRMTREELVREIAERFPAFFASPVWQTRHLYPLLDALRAAAEVTSDDA